MLRLIIFFLIVSTSATVLSQSVDDLLDSSKVYYSQGHWEDAHILIDQAYQKSQLDKNFHGQIRAIHVKGWVFHQSGDLSQGVSNYLKVIELSSERPDSVSLHFEIYARMNIGSIFRKEELFDLAVPIVLRGIELCDQIGYDDVKFSLQDNLQRLYRSTGNIKQALEINHEILRASSRNSSQNLKALNALGIIHQLDGHFDLAKYYYEKLYEEALLAKSKKYESYALHNLGDVHYDQLNYSTSVEYYLKAIEAKSNAKTNANDKHTSHRDIAKAYAKLDMFDEAIYHGNMAEQYLLQVENCLECDVKLYSVFSELMKTQGDETHENFYSEKLAIATDQFNKEQLELSYESKQPELRQVVNEYYAELRSQQEAKASQTLLFSVIAGFVSLILILGVYHIYSRSRVRRTLTAELEKLNWD